MGKGGERTSDAGASMLDDPQLAPFRQDDFNVAEFTSRVLAASTTTAQAQAEQLKQGVNSLEAELSQHVTGRHRDLLQIARKLNDTENSLQEVVLSVDSLQSATKRVRAEIVGPYEQIRTKTRQLSNLHATIDTLRHLIHRLKLTQKLRALLAAGEGAAGGGGKDSSSEPAPPPALDLAKAAKLLTDIAAVDAEADLSGVAAAAADADFLRSAGNAVREQAEAALSEGMESMSQAKVGAALQVFFNLDELQQAVALLVARYGHGVEKALKAGLDARQLSSGAAGGPSSSSSAAVGALSSSGRVQGGGSGGLQEKLWTNVKEVCEQTLAATVAVWHLQRVVAKKRDPLTHVCFLDVLTARRGEPLPTERLWAQLVRAWGEALHQMAKPAKGGIVREMLVVGYPRLAASLEGMFERLVGETSVKGVAPAVGDDHLRALLATTAPFQQAYLNASLGRMTDAVVAAFPGGSRSLPSPADVQKVIGAMHEELKLGGTGSPQLAAVVAATVGQALKLLADRAEYMAATGPEVRALAAAVATGSGGGSGGANAAQVRNILLSSQLQEVHRALVGLLARLPPTSAAALSSALEAVQDTAVAVVAPIFQSAVDVVEECILRIHDLPLGEEGGAGGGSGMVHTSPCIARCGQAIAAFRAEYLSKFLPPPSPNVQSSAAALVQRMACRALTFFLRHAALVRPLCQAGKLQLAKDLAELQAAVGQHLYPLEALGAPYRATRAFRTLLFQDTAALLAGALPPKDLPPSLVAHHLFSRLPAAVQAPHQQSGLSAAQYSAWLDQHSGAEVMASVRNCLLAAGSGSSAAAAAVKAEPGAADIVAAMVKMCQDAAASS